MAGCCCSELAVYSELVDPLQLAVPQGVGLQKPTEPVLVDCLELVYAIDDPDVKQMRYLERADLRAVGTGLMLGLMPVEGPLVLEMESQVLPRATWKSPSDTTRFLGQLPA